MLLLVVAEVHDNDSKHHNYNSNDKHVIVISLSLSLSLSASGPPIIVILSAYFVLSAGVSSLIDFLDGLQPLKYPNRYRSRSSASS